jgi:hypothetical protein
MHHILPDLEAVCVGYRGDPPPAKPHAVKPRNRHEAMLRPGLRNPCALLLPRRRGSRSTSLRQRRTSPFKQRGGRVDARPHALLRVTSDGDSGISAAQQESGAATEATSRSVIDAAQQLFEIAVASIV